MSAQPGDEGPALRLAELIESRGFRGKLDIGESFGRAVVAEIRRLASTGSDPAPSAWQPIETAPKDGETLLLFATEDGDQFFGYRPLDCPDDAACDRMGTASYPKWWRRPDAAPTPEPQA